MLAEGSTMSTIVRVATMVASAVALAGLVAIGAPSAAQATQLGRVGSMAHPNSLGCGYDGYVINGYPTYNHCGRGSVVIEVDHVFWQHKLCVHAARCLCHHHRATSVGPLSAPKPTDHTCTFTQPISIVGLEHGRRTPI